MRMQKFGVALLVASLLLVGCSNSQSNRATESQNRPLASLPQPKLPAIFGDNMVLQRNNPIRFWGTAQPGQVVSVKVAENRGSTTAGAHGKWNLQLAPVPAGGPYEVTITGGAEPIVYRNVMVGEVWVCSGQSNMEFGLRGASNAQQAIDSATNPNLRLFTVKKAQSDIPATDCVGQWTPSTPDAATSFSAVGYFFGKELQASLNVPVGLIHTSWGGTPIEVWTSRTVFDREAENQPFLEQYAKRKAEYPEALEKYLKAMQTFKNEQAKAKAEGKPAPKQPNRPQPPMAPSCLYNAMIAPLVPYSIGGAIWYQGESNAGRAIEYRKQFPAMIQNWRADFDQDFPFLFVQLANYTKREDQPSDPAWAWLREAQTMTLSTPKTGMAVIIDIGEANDIHPKNKADVGKRLALAAEAVAYGQKIVYSGPMYESMRIDGDRIVLKFRDIGGGLMARDGANLTGFAIAGSDKKFVWADARIDGETVVVSAAGLGQ